MTAYHKQVGEFSSCISSTFVGESDSSIIFPGEQNGILARFNICDALRYLVPFAQFKKSKKHPWRVMLLIRLQLLKVSLLHGFFLRF